VGAEDDASSVPGALDAPGAPGYAERLRPSWWLWLVVVGLGVGFGLVAAPFGATVAVTVTVVMSVVLGVLLLRSTGTVAVADGRFVAGRARIPVHLLGEAEALDAAAMRQARGPGLDARAYLYLRPWVDPGVRVAVSDPADPAPYWLVSTRRPEQVVAALARARRH
jgi:hypothetical protein